MEIRTYNELMQFRTFDERYDYLKLNGRVADLTFGFDRYLNQVFYKSPIWLKRRDDIIVRDLGCDLGLKGYEIYKVYALSIYAYLIFRISLLCTDPYYSRRYGTRRSNACNNKTIRHV